MAPEVNPNMEIVYILEGENITDGERLRIPIEVFNSWPIIER